LRGKDCPARRRNARPRGTRLASLL
jgi:hypothetical protein